MRTGSTMWRRSPMTCVKSATTSQVETIYQYLNASYISCLDHSCFDVNHFLIKVNLRCRGSFHSGGGHQGGDRARHQPDDVSVHGITSLHYCQDDTNSVTPVKLALYFIYEIIITDILAFCFVYKANTNSCCCNSCISVQILSG